MTVSGLSLTPSAAPGAGSKNGADAGVSGQKGATGFSDTWSAARDAAAAGGGRVATSGRDAKPGAGRGDARVGKPASATRTQGSGRADAETPVPATNVGKGKAISQRAQAPGDDDLSMAVGAPEGQVDDAMPDVATTLSAMATKSPASLGGAGRGEGPSRDRTVDADDGEDSDKADVDGDARDRKAAPDSRNATDPSGAAPAMPTLLAVGDVTVMPRPGAAYTGKGDEGARATTRPSGTPADSAATQVKPAPATAPVAAAPAQPLPDASVAPVLAALADAAKGASPPPANDAAPSVPATPVAAAPRAVERDAQMPATAAMLGARMAVTGKNGGGDRDAAEPRKPARDDAAASVAEAHILPGVSYAAPAPGATGVAVAATPDAGTTLAAQGADRQLDLARQGAWLDSLSRDIASAGVAAGGTMRFQVSPQHLGTVQVEMNQTADGAASLVLTTASEASRVLLLDARPQLVADARAHGIHIASAEIAAAASAQASSPDSQRQGGQSQSESHHHTPFSSQNGAQNGGQGTNGGGSQTRSQPIAFTTELDGRSPLAAQEADVPDATAPDDGLYA